MGFLVKRYWLVWLALGLFAGLMLGGLWPHAPLHAVATDRAEDVVVTTAFLDESVEAYFYLNSMTGTLIGGVPSRHAKGAFQASWSTNVNNDLRAAIVTLNSTRRGAGPAVEPPKTPKYLMVSGSFDISRSSGRERPGRSMLYITEVNSGVVMAYMISWSPEAHNAGQLYPGKLAVWSIAPLSTAIVRDRE